MGDRGPQKPFARTGGLVPEARIVGARDIGGAQRIHPEVEDRVGRQQLVPDTAGDDLQRAWRDLGPLLAIDCEQPGLVRPLERHQQNLSVSMSLPR